MPIAVECKSCVFCKEIEKHDGDEVVHCSCWERAVSLFATSVYNERQRQTGMGWSRIYPQTECRFFFFRSSSAVKYTLLGGKLISKPFNWQEYRDVQVHQV